ncbi:MAG: DUF2997 domain-containing protein [Chloroflexi bacterium]|nr:DUF2997 domain-containing protein [Chloroflexota bacterium]
MPEIEFTIDVTTGDLTMHVKGIAGPACEDLARLARELLGEPALDQSTSEYYVRPRVQRQIRPRQGS